MTMTIDVFLWKSVFLPDYRTEQRILQPTSEIAKEKDSTAMALSLTNHPVVSSFSLANAAFFRSSEA